MAYTQDQVDALKAALATGTKIVRNANGEYIEYQSFAEMRQQLAVMQAEVAGPARRRAVNVYPSYSRYPDASSCDDPPLSQPT